MMFSLSEWMLYTMWAVFGLMILDLLLGFLKSFWKGTLTSDLILGYLKDVLYYVVPLNFIISMFPIDPTGWILIVFFFVGGLGVIIKYVLEIIKKFK
ncbi:hypothetical protein [Bacillus sp. USDA818B3_A]|uniref:hypothetical protein n=1 Tax=Bacillus sp. USDA818B3_A TaxID=2698834 RepID=UPI00136B2AE4|nr:hypothetical protein [Bacillus sp. USDA818B3_A]